MQVKVISISSTFVFLVTVDRLDYGHNAQYTVNGNHLPLLSARPSEAGRWPRSFTSDVHLPSSLVEEALLHDLLAHRSLETSHHHLPWAHVPSFLRLVRTLASLPQPPGDCDGTGASRMEDTFLVVLAVVLAVVFLSMWSSSSLFLLSSSLNLLLRLLGFLLSWRSQMEEGQVGSLEYIIVLLICSRIDLFWWW